MSEGQFTPHVFFVHAGWAPYTDTGRQVGRCIADLGIPSGEVVRVKSRNCSPRARPQADRGFGCAVHPTAALGDGSVTHVGAGLQRVLASGELHSTALSGRVSAVIYVGYGATLNGLIPGLLNRRLAMVRVSVDTTAPFSVNDPGAVFQPVTGWVREAFSPHWGEGVDLRSTVTSGAPS